MSVPSRFPRPSEKQGRILWLSVTALSVGVLLGLLGLLLWGVGFVLNILAPVLWPLAIAGVLAYLLDPVVDYIQSKKVSRFWAIILTFLLCVLVFLGFLASVVPQLIKEGQAMIRDFPEYSLEARKKIASWIEVPPWKSITTHFGETNGVESAGSTNGVGAGVEPATTNLPASGAVTPAPEPGPGVTPPAPEVVVGAGPSISTNEVAGPGSAQEAYLSVEFGEKVVGWLTRVAPQVGGMLKSVVSRLASWAGMAIGLALVPVFCFYFLLEEDNIRAGWANYLPVKDSWFKDELVFVISAINDYLIVFFRGQVLVALCDGVLFSIGFLAVGLNYAILIGVVAGALSIVPYLGAILTIVPAVLLATVQFHDWLHPLLVVLVFSAVQALEGFVISPKIMGDRVGLHPFTIILAVLIGSLLMGGILGGILAIPLTAAARVLMFRYIWKKPDTSA